jgi:hypothetical protein
LFRNYSGVARWFILRPKMPICLYFVGLEWKLLVNFIAIYGHFVRCVAVGYSLWSFGIFFRLDQKNLATQSNSPMADARFNSIRSVCQRALGLLNKQLPLLCLTPTHSYPPTSESFVGVCNVYIDIHTM